MIILKQMTVLFVIMLIGYYAYRRQLITEASGKTISGIVINIANPALILSSVISGGERIKGRDLLLTMTAAIVIFLSLLAVAEILPKLLRAEKNSRGIYKMMTVFSNFGFMGFPIIASVYGNEALLYASLFVIPYNLLIYTYGIRVLQKEQVRVKGVAWKRVFNIGVIASLISVLLFLTDIKLPEIPVTIITMLSSLTAPLSMLVIGASFGSMNLKKLFLDKRQLLFALIKLIIIPVIGITLLSLFIHNRDVLGVCLVVLAAPVGSMTVMLAQQYEGDYELVARGIALTTILSVITIPLVSMILKL